MYGDKGHFDEVSDAKSLNMTATKQQQQQMEISNMLLEIRRMIILIIKWQRTWLSCSSVLQKGKLTSYEIRYLVEETSKQSIEGVAWLLLTVHYKT